MASEESKYATILLANQIKEMYKNPPSGISVGLVDESGTFFSFCFEEIF